jgi:hypothetical protein
MRILFLIMGTLALSGCASTLNSRYSEYLEQINDKHDAELRDTDDSPIADIVDSRSYLNDFADKACGGVKNSKCWRQYKEAVYTQLAHRYYAADLDKMTEVCASDPVNCGVKQWELLACKSHNEGIEWHRERAIEALEQWRTSTELARDSNIPYRMYVAPAPSPSPASSMTHPASFQCMTNTIGGTTITNCE